MKPLMAGVVADLRNRGLLPVAIALLLALLAVPVLLGNSAEAPAPAASPVTPVATTPDGLPAPDEALLDKPLVTLATLKTPSKLESFDSRNPFQPLRGLDEIAAGDDGGTPNSVSPSADLASSGPSSEPSSGLGGSGTDPSVPFDITPGPDATPAPAPLPDPGSDPDPPAEKKLTYAVDLTFGLLDDLARLRNTQRLRVLPDASSPLLIFLGVDVTGQAATFLVDATLRAQPGEGTCAPSTAACATLSIAPGEQRTFIDDADQTYLLRLDQIREIPVTEAAAQLKKLADLSSADRRQEPVRRFVVPQLSDLLVLGGQ